MSFRRCNIESIKIQEYFGAFKESCNLKDFTGKMQPFKSPTPLPKTAHILLDFRF